MSNDSNFDSLFTPFSIGKMEIKNRLVMSPMGTYAALMDGSVSDTLATYFEERAKGGVGAIITASQYLTPKLAQGIYGTYFDSKRIIPHLTGMTERIHCYGAKAIAQLSSGTGRNAHPSQCGGVPFSASAVPAVFNPKILCRPLTIEEIKEIMKSWQLAAEIAANAGYDAIEVHGHVGYIIDQFLTRCGTSVKTNTAAAMKTVLALRWRSCRPSSEARATICPLFTASPWIIASPAAERLRTASASLRFSAKTVLTHSMLTAAAMSTPTSCTPPFTAATPAWSMCATPHVRRLTNPSSTLATTHPRQQST